MSSISCLCIVFILCFIMYRVWRSSAASTPSTRSRHCPLIASSYPHFTTYTKSWYHITSPSPHRLKNSGALLRSWTSPSLVAGHTMSYRMSYHVDNKSMLSHLVNTWAHTYELHYSDYHGSVKPHVELGQFGEATEVNTHSHTYTYRSYMPSIHTCIYT